MRRMRALFPIVSIIILSASIPLLAGHEGGLPGYQLQLNPDTKSWGMGLVATSTTENTTALFWNPACLSNVDRNQLMLSHQNLWGQANFGFLSYARPTLSGTYAFGFSQVSTGMIDEKDAMGNSVGSFTDAFRILYFGYGADLFKHLAFGFSAKGLSHNFFHTVTYGYSFNGGVLIKPYRGLAIGLSLADVYGRELEKKKLVAKFAMIKRIGLSYSAFNKKFVIGYDLQWGKNLNYAGGFGVEYFLLDQIALRFGRYRMANTFGIGLKISDLLIDFAFVEHELGTRKQFSITHSFGRSVSATKREIQERKKESEELLATGKALYDKQDYEAALKKFQAAVKLRPEFSEAKKLAEKTDKIVTNFKKAEEAISLNKYLRARQILVMVLALEPNFKKAKQLVAEVQKKAELRKKAETYFRGGLEYEKQGLLSDAIDMWKKTLAIDQNHQGALNKLEHYEQLEPLKCEISEINDVFAAIYKYYADNPFGTLTIRNKDNISLHDVKVTIMVQKYLDFPTPIKVIQTFPGNAEIQVPIRAVFNNNLLSLTEDTRVSAEITVSYNFRNLPVERTLTTSFMIYNRNVIRWDDTEKVASFITAKDPIVRYFANGVLQSVNYDKFESIPKKIVQAMAIFEGMSAAGIKYVPDPNNPYAKVSADRNTIDLVWYPRETLHQLSGDCDDLTVLYCSLLESINISTRIIDVPGHLFMAFDTGLDAKQGKLVSPKASDYLVIDNHIWLPVETTQTSNGFFSAWQSGVNLFHHFQREANRDNG